MTPPDRDPTAEAAPPDPEEEAQLDADLRFFFDQRTDAVSKAADFIDRVQEYARLTLRRDGTPGPLETEANVVGTLLRAHFKADLERREAHRG